MKRSGTNNTERMVGFRATTEDLRRLDALTEKTGLPRSDVFRALIRAADATPVVSWVPALGSGEMAGSAQ